MASRELRVLITAVDRLSPFLQRQARSLNALKRQFDAVGKGGVVMGAGLVAGMTLATKSFMELEDATTTLKNSLMIKNGSIPEIFKSISQQTIELGNALPGTTADFAKMASTLKSLGVSPEIIANGSLKATAYLGLVAKDVGVTYETAADAVGKLGNEFGIVGNDLVVFADTLQRALHIGPKLEQMQYGMSRFSGLLQVLGFQGIDTANKIAPLVALLARKGIEGEQISTGLTDIFEVIHHNRPGIKTIEGYIAVLDKLNHLPESKRMELMSRSKAKGGFGEHWTKAAHITLKSYQEVADEMNAQGDIIKKIANISQDLSTKVESAGGTWGNFMAAFGGTYSVQLKDFADRFNEMAEKLGKWTIANGPAIKTALEMAGVFVGLKVASLGLAAGIGVLTAAMKLNPLMLLAQAVAIAAPYIMENWDEIEKRLISGTQNIIKFFEPLIDLFKWFINNDFVKFIGSAAIYLGKSVGKLMPNLPDLSAPTSPGMRAPGYNRQSIIGPRNGLVDVNIRFDNAPAGMRVGPEQSRGPVRVSQDVGYRSFKLGIP